MSGTEERKRRKVSVLVCRYCSVALVECFGIFTRKTSVTYRVAAGQVVRIMDKKVWRLHVASLMPEPREFAEYYEDVSAMKQWPLQLINACS